MQAITALGCMEHRGACSADDVSGDGAGIMSQIPWEVVKRDVPQTDPATCGCASATASAVPAAAALCLGGQTQLDAT